MSQNIAVFNWAASDAAAICALQTTGGAGNFIINGTLASVGTGYSPYYAMPTVPIVNFVNISRTVSITSTGNISGVNFTIKGTYRGAPQTETRAGPNNTTVYTTALFDTVTSVSVNGAVGTNTSVGSGTTGQTWWYKNNFYQTAIGLTVQVVITPTTTINYSFQTTLDDAHATATPNVFTPITALTGATGNQLGSYLVPTRYSNIIINSSTNGALVATFLQQGIT